MKKTLYIIFFCSLLSIGLHLYLSERSYSIATDKAGASSICHISHSWNCDNTLNSSYSEFAGIPLSNWGFATHLIIAFLALLLLLGWTENSSLIWFTLSCLATFSAGASLTMLGVSLFFLHLFCPFCIALYFLSFITIVCVFPHIKQALSLSSLKKACLFLSSAFALLVLASILTHLIFMNTHNIKSTDRIVISNIKDWISAPIKHIKEKALLTTGPLREEALITIVEFADFLCPHCRDNYYILKIFKASNPQTRIEYFSFPLDQCKTKRASCALIRAVYCAEKQNQGWNMHGLIFDNQKKFIPLKEDKKAFQKVKEIGHQLPLTWDKWFQCTESSTAMDIQNKQIKAGNDINITGTPTILVNGKKVHHKYFTKTIKAIQKYLKQTRKERNSDAAVSP